MHLCRCTQIRVRRCLCSRVWESCEGENWKVGAFSRIPRALVLHLAGAPWLKLRVYVSRCPSGVPKSQLFCSLDDQKYIILRYKYTEKSNKWKLKECGCSQLCYAPFCCNRSLSDAVWNMRPACLIASATDSVYRVSWLFCPELVLVSGTSYKPVTPPLDRYNNAASPVCPMQHDGLNPKLLGLVLGLDLLFRVGVVRTENATGRKRSQGSWIIHDET